MDSFDERLDACVDAVDGLHRRFDSFEEGKHKRDQSGKFASGSGGGGGSGGGSPGGGSGEGSGEGSRHHHEALTSRGFKLNKPTGLGSSHVYEHASGHKVTVDPESGEFAVYHKPKSGGKIEPEREVAGGLRYHTGGKSGARLSKILEDKRYQD